MSARAPNGKAGADESTFGIINARTSLVRQEFSHTLAKAGPPRLKTALQERGFDAIRLDKGTMFTDFLTLNRQSGEFYSQVQIQGHLHRSPHLNPIRPGTGNATAPIRKRLHGQPERPGMSNVHRFTKTLTSIPCGRFVHKKSHRITTALSRLATSQKRSPFKLNSAFPT
jgi:hypothetical protein